MKTTNLPKQILLLILAIVFSIALMFAFTELPRLLDTLLAKSVNFPLLDHGRDELSAIKYEIYASSLHLRWIGYACLGLVIGFIIVGFASKRSGWALADPITLPAIVYLLDDDDYEIRFFARQAIRKIEKAE